MPSRRPVKPRPSVVVALTPTRSASIAKELGDARAHGVAMRADAGGLADEW